MNLRTLCTLTAAAVLLAGCPTSTPSECATKADCFEDQACQDGKCVATSLSDGGETVPDGGAVQPDGGAVQPDGGVARTDGGVGCTPACSGATPVCDTATRTCVGCLDNGDCSGATPYCSTMTKTCVACSPAGCPATLKVVSASSTSTTTVVVEFERAVDTGTLLPNGSQFTFTGGLTASAASAAGAQVRVTTSAQAPGATYTVTVATTVQDTGGVAVGATGNSAQFTVPAAQAKLLLNEINPNIPNSRDLIELLVVEAGTTKGMTVVEEGKANDPLTFSTLPDVAMQVGDLVVLHLNPVDADDPKASERTSKAESTAANAYPNAWDFVGGSAAVTFSHRLIEVVGADGVIQDAVAFAKVGLPEPLPGGFEPAVVAAQAQGEWSPADCGGAQCSYTSTPSVVDISVDWSGVGNTTGSSLSRVGGADTDSKADWVLKATGASFGAANP